MIEPVYTNSFNKPVYQVNWAGIKKNDNGLYELQLNDRYFQITEEMLKTLSDIKNMPDNVGVLIG